jgi:nucleotide-binding universal stress UspA family protein
MARFGEIAGAQTEATAKAIKGDPKIAILDEAEHWKPGLIVVGTHGYNAFERLWLGSVSRAVLTHAPCSVEVVRRKGQDGTERAKKILLAVDGSEYSDAAVEEVARRPWPPGSKVLVIAVAHVPFTPNAETWALPQSSYTRLEKAEREQGEMAVKRAISRLHESNANRAIPLTLTEKVEIGHPEEAIIETARTWDADLILLGSHGYRRFKRFLLGSVSQAVASHAPCSVEIVRKPAAGE